MYYLWQHIENILSIYDGKVPLHHFLKAYFKNHPKLGSRDRKGLSDAVYAWYRAGKALAADKHEVQQKRLAAMQLCGLYPKAFAAFFPKRSQAEKNEYPADFSVQLPHIFPYDIPFSPGITKEDWSESLLHQPRLFLRIRNNRSAIDKLLTLQGVTHSWISDNCLALPNSTKLEGLIQERDYVVQDASSQGTGAFLKAKAGERWWDCCSGAGGKSLMLADNSGGTQLLATDIRESILQNLAARFRKYGLSLPERRVLDAADSSAVRNTLGPREFDGIICDVPCSGSGTWARTPESCYFFNPEAIPHYAERQTAILKNATEYLSPNGHIVYITCSVFQAENEDVITEVAAKTGMRIETSRLINGIGIAADSLFVAILQKA